MYSVLVIESAKLPNIFHHHESSPVDIRMNSDPLRRITIMSKHDYARSSRIIHIHMERTSFKWSRASYLAFKTTLLQINEI